MVDIRCLVREDFELIMTMYPELRESMKDYFERATDEPVPTWAVQTPVTAVTEDDAVPTATDATARLDNLEADVAAMKGMIEGMQQTLTRALKAQGMA